MIDVGWGGPAEEPLGSIVVSFNTVVVELNGSTVAADTVLSVHWEYGWDKPVGEAQVVLSERPASGNYHDELTITVNDQLRFRGLVTNFDYGNWPRTVGIQAKTRMCLVEEYTNQAGDTEPDEGQPGLDIETLLGAPTGTLRDFVVAVLTLCEVGVSMDRLANPPHVYGLVAPEEFTWRIGEGGLAFLHRLFEASAGYRLFDSADGGDPYLAQISGRPEGSVDFFLTDGIDILDGAKSGRAIEQSFNCVHIRGYDDGEEPIDVLVIEGTDFPPDRTFTVNSPLIEDEAFATELTTHWLREGNRELVNTSVSTWRDVRYGPAQIIRVDALLRLGMGEPAWTLNTSGEVDERGALTQALALVAGGT